MRKILIIVIIVLLIAFGYVSLTNGIKIGGLVVSSIKQIDENSKQLETKTEEANSMIDVQYPKKISELKDAANKMQDTKQKYLDATNVTSDAELQSAATIVSYDIEKLWTKLGRHASTEGVNIKLSINSSSSGANDSTGKTMIKDLAFTVNGSYIGITNYLYALEDDDELNFRIYNFKLSPYQNSILQATFTVKDVRIKADSLNESLTVTSTTTDNTNTANNTNTTDNTNTTNNTNTNATNQ